MQLRLFSLQLLQDVLFHAVPTQLFKLLAEKYRKNIQTRLT